MGVSSRLEEGELDLRFQNLLQDPRKTQGRKVSQQKRSGLLANLAKWGFGAELIWLRRIKKYDLSTLSTEQVVPFRHV